MSRHTRPIFRDEERSSRGAIAFRCGRPGALFTSAVLLPIAVLAGCSDGSSAGTGGTGGAVDGTGGFSTGGASGGASSGGTTSGGTGGVSTGGSGGAIGGAGGSGAMGSGAIGSGAAGSGASGSGGAGGSGGSGGSTSEACHEPSDAGSLFTRLPCLLSETGLYEADMVTLAEGVHPYTPQFKLWTDSAAKKRWVQLPPDTQIDTTDMDYWEYPPGTKLWKEFERDGVRVETRLIEKQPNGVWYPVAYQWRDDQMEADAVPNGVDNASGTEHDIPNTDQCLKCHSQVPDKALGFSAIQLSHDPVDSSDPLEWTLTSLIEGDLLTNPPAATFTVPGTPDEVAFFGYLHANCGHCHNPRGGANGQTGLDMWLKVDDLDGPVTEFSVYQNVYDVDIAWLDGERPDATKRVVPGSPEDSAVYQRFVTKGENWSMPPLGTEVTDPQGQQIMETWIQSLGQ